MVLTGFILIRALWSLYVAASFRDVSTSWVTCRMGGDLPGGSMFLLALLKLG